MTRKLHASSYQKCFQKHTIHRIEGTNKPSAEFFCNKIRIQKKQTSKEITTVLVLQKLLLHIYTKKINYEHCLLVIRY